MSPPKPRQPKPPLTSFKLLAPSPRARPPARPQEAHRLESATASRLLQAKKLSLIVDLDQTIVHATVDPTVGEWLQDPDNPNYKALDGVKRFKLLDEMPMRRPKRSRTSTTGGTTTPGLSTALPTPGLSESGTTDDGESVDEDDAPGCYYYIKMRCVQTSLLSFR
jgi:RNA polymerase II subunit A-like phosphatase